MFKVNRIIRVLIVSDFVLNAGWGLLGPIFAIFLVRNIAIGSVEEGARIAGFASLFYWITKSFLQVPIAHYLDKHKGEKDDFWFMTLGTFLAVVVPFGYLISALPWHIYFFQIVQAVAMAMVLPSWSAIFTRNIDKGREAVEWSLSSTSLGLAEGMAAAVGGIIMSAFGPKLIFVLVGTFTFLSALLLLLIQKDIIAPGEQKVSAAPYRHDLPL